MKNIIIGFIALLFVSCAPIIHEPNLLKINGLDLECYSIVEVNELTAISSFLVKEAKNGKSIVYSNGYMGLLIITFKDKTEKAE